MSLIAVMESDLLSVIYDVDDFALQVTYTPISGPPKITSVFITHGITRVGFESDAIGMHDEVEFLLSEIPTPKRGDTLNDGVDTYTLISPINDDGKRAVWIVSA